MAIIILAVVIVVAVTVLAVAVPVAVLAVKKLSGLGMQAGSHQSSDLLPVTPQQTDEISAESSFESSFESTDTAKCSTGNVTAHHAEMNAVNQKVLLPAHNINIDVPSIDSYGSALDSQHSALNSRHSALLFPIKTNTATSPRRVNRDQRTFATSNFKRCYDGAKAPMFQHRLLAAVHDMLKQYVRRIKPALDPHQLDEGTNAFMKDIQGEAFRHNEVLEKDVGAAAEYLWTSAKTHAVVNYKQLYSAINAVIRDDVMEEVKTAVVFCRAINTRRVRRVTKGADDMSYPRNGETWRGGGFRSQHRAFFEGMIGKKYRVPGFLATSAKRSIAAKFAFAAFEEDDSHPCVIWRVRVDPRGKMHPEHRVKHMTFVSKTLVEGEEEYLFAPYSVFTLVSAEWSDRLSKPHEFTVQAARDNKITK